MGSEFIAVLALSVVLLELWIAGYATVQVWRYSRRHWHPPVAVGATALAFPIICCGGWLVFAIWWLRVRDFWVGRSFGDLLFVGLRCVVGVGVILLVASLAWAMVG